MKVFLDTNIILDLLLEREGYEDSAELFGLQDEGKLKLYVSILTMVNVAYVYKKTVGAHMANVNIKYLSALVNVLPMDSSQMQKALLMSGPDFEDLLQATCAAEAGCDCIVTRNIKDYRIRKGLTSGLSLPTVLTPSALKSTL
ncbi:MAG: PIN domain-containing protein [Bacteroidales bacterium]|nr:PIN domain-containing protein [Bacteroidales bacterium]